MIYVMLTVGGIALGLFLASIRFRKVDKKTSVSDNETNETVQFISPDPTFEERFKKANNITDITNG